ncbi:MAG: XdhC family protein [Alphaproteobacteria bacterium]
MSASLAEVLARIDALRAAGDDFCVVTVVRTALATSAKAGAKAVVTADGTVHGFVGGGCVTGAVRRVALEAIGGGEPRLIRVKPKDEVAAAVDTDGVELHRSSCPSGGTVDLFLEPMSQPPRIAVCGASPVALALCRLARAMGNQVIAATLAEDRAKVADADRWVEGVALDGLRPRDAAVVVTQGKRDREALLAALGSAAGYVGMVGSRTKIGKLRAQIADAVPAERLAALRGPAGIAIGAIDPEEIALAILAEIIAVRRADVRAAAGASSAVG